MSSSKSTTTKSTDPLEGDHPEKQNNNDDDETKSKSVDYKEKEKKENTMEPCNDLIIDNGFPVLNNFHLSKSKEINNESPRKKDPIPRCSFASFANALSLSSNKMRHHNLLNDCEKVFTARTKDGDAAYSAGCTFFVPCHMKPRCALEQLALDIFRTHTQGLEGLFDEERSGAEWWTLVLESSPSSDTNKDDDNDNNVDNTNKEEENEYDEDDDEVGMHFDADYGLESQLPHYMLHPRVATVTYLSNAGVPTLVLEKQSPPPADVTKSSLNGDVEKAWISHPCVGKHIAFDGRLLHGAPGTFFPAAGGGGSGENEGVEGDDNVGKEDGMASSAAKRQKIDKNGANAPCASNIVVDDDQDGDDLSNKRVTFLVNVWLNHCPIDAELLDDEICESMITPWRQTNNNDNNNKKEKENGGTNVKVKRKKGDDDDDDDDSPPFEWKLQNTSKPDPIETTSLEAVASGGDAEPAGSEETVLCNREVTIYFNSSMKECHRVSQLAAATVNTTNITKSAQIELGKKALTIAVGNEVVESDDEEAEDS